MSNSFGVNGNTTVSYSNAGFDAGVTNMSPDSLLAYCQMQLGDLDTQVNNQMTAQKTALREREAVESAQTALGRFGTAGPQKPEDMQKCVDALNSAIAQLPPGDPVAGQLSDFRDKMTTQYGYAPGRRLTGAEELELSAAETEAAGTYGTLADQQAARRASDDVNRLHAIEQGTFTRPNADNKEWQGTTDALNIISNDIKSSAEIQLLQLNNLVSQRQQAISLCSGMMSRTDQTLEDQAKAIGHG
jgi:hypothetical protein